MDADSAVVGIDVSKKKLDVALLSNGKIKSKVVDNSATGFGILLDWLGKSKIQKANLHVCMEATGVYYEALALTLHGNGIVVSVINPACIKGFGKSENIRNKNDGVDAGLIARYCLAIKPEPWTPPSLAQRQLRAWASRVQGLKDIHQQEVNRLEALSAADLVNVAANVREHIYWLEAEIKRLEKDISDHIDRHPDLKHDADLIGSIPGIGVTTVAKILGTIGDVRRFDNAKAFAAFLGVTPKQKISGTSIRGRTTLSRAGNKGLRAALFMPSLVAQRHNPLLKQFSDRLLATGMAKMAVVGAVMHKMAHLIYGVIHTGKPFDSKYRSRQLAIQDGI